MNYLNTVLTSGTVSPALVTALPSLLSVGGGSNGAAFALLNPEAYASASQIGTANALTISEALRSTNRDTMRSEHGYFTFGEGIGGWRQLRGAAGLGTARANVNSGGVLGGIGVGSGAASLAAFGGYLDSRQVIGTLGLDRKGFTDHFGGD